MERETVEQSRERYMRAAHAMQTGVVYILQHDEKSGTPKDLRVGVNSAMVEHAGLATLLIDKGIITVEEYGTAMADAMEREAAEHQRVVSELVGTEVTLR